MTAQEDSKNQKPELFIDNERFDWQGESITGKQLRELGAVPDGVDVFWKRPGKPDQEILADEVVDLSLFPGPDRFFTQAVGSQAG